MRLLLTCYVPEIVTRRSDAGRCPDRPDKYLLEESFARINQLHTASSS